VGIAWESSTGKFNSIQSPWSLAINLLLLVANRASSSGYKCPSDHNIWALAKVA
jgi:hypothetical protein